LTDVKKRKNLLERKVQTNGVSFYIKEMYEVQKYNSILTTAEAKQYVIPSSYLNIKMERHF